MVVGEIQGTGVALVTPFTQSGGVDFSALERLVNHVIDGGVNYLVALGTTGESVTLTKSEKIAVLEKIKEVAGNRLPVILGHGGSNTRVLIETLNDYDLEGISAVLSLPFRCCSCCLASCAVLWILISNRCRSIQFIILVG